MDKPSLGVCSGVFLLQLMAAGGICAENLPDPTRPPASLGPLPPAFGAESEPSPLPVLQSIILSASRHTAIISGQSVELGGKLGGFRLIKLTPGEAVMKGTEGIQVLKLFPEVEKKEHVAPSAQEPDGKKPVARKKAKS